MKRRRLLLGVNADRSCFVIKNDDQIPILLVPWGIWGQGFRYLFKLVYHKNTNMAWAHWHENDNAIKGSKLISYTDLVKRTGIEFLPGVQLGE